MTAVVGAGTGSLDDRGALLRWAGAFCLVAAVHAGGAVALLRHEARVPAVDAPEAAVLIDLPPEFALPPAESVESIAAPAVEADAAEEVAADVPPEAVEVLPETVEAAAIATAVEADAVPDGEALVPETSVAIEAAPVDDVAPEAVADAEAAPVAEEVAPQDAPQALPEEVADTPAEVVESVETAAVEPVAATVAEAVAAEETVTAEEAVPPAPAVRPRAKPRPPARVVETPRAVRQRPAVQAAERPRRTEQARPAPSEATIAGERASGAGRPDPDALAAYGASVRARIMRQRRSVDASTRSGARVTVRFTVAANGAVSGISVAQSSGDAALDAAAVAMVERAGPLPPIPAAVGRSSLPMSLPVRFDR